MFLELWFAIGIFIGAYAGITVGVAWWLWRAMDAELKAHDENYHTQTRD